MPPETGSACHAIEVGEFVMTGIGAANHDPAKFGPTADDLDLGRPEPASTCRSVLVSTAASAPPSPGWRDKPSSDRWSDRPQRALRVIDDGFGGASPLTPGAE